jgi:hypothetical protein
MVSESNESRSISDVRSSSDDTSAPPPGDACGGLRLEESLDALRPVLR